MNSEYSNCEARKKKMLLSPTSGFCALNIIHHFGSSQFAFSFIFVRFQIQKDSFNSLSSCAAQVVC